MSCIASSSWGIYGLQMTPLQRLLLLRLAIPVSLTQLYVIILLLCFSLCNNPASLIYLYIKSCFLGFLCVITLPSCFAMCNNPDSLIQVSVINKTKLWFLQQSTDHSIPAIPLESFHPLTAPVKSKSLKSVWALSRLLWRKLHLLSYRCRDQAQEVVPLKKLPPHSKLCSATSPFSYKMYFKVWRSLKTVYHFPWPCMGIHRDELYPRGTFQFTCDNPFTLVSASSKIWECFFMDPEWSSLRTFVINILSGNIAVVTFF